jgi:hypothetical protein
LSARRVKGAYGESAYDLAVSAFQSRLQSPEAKDKILEVGVSTWLSERRQFMDTVSAGGEFSDEDLAKWGTTIRDSIVGGLSAKFQGKTGDALTREVNMQLIDTIARVLETNRDGFDRVEAALVSSDINPFR